MKTALDPRHQRRILLMQALFAQSFPPVHSTGSTQQDITDITLALPQIDRAIHLSAPEWPVDKIAKIDLAILRLAIFELLNEKKEPPKVIIDEAVELAKEFGNDNSAKFVNGVLGTILKEKKEID